MRNAVSKDLHVFISQLLQFFPLFMTALAFNYNFFNTLP